MSQRSQVEIIIKPRYRVVKSDNSQFDCNDCFTGITMAYYSTYAEAKTFVNGMNDQYFEEVKWAVSQNVVIAMQLNLRLGS